MHKEIPVLRDELKVNKDGEEIIDLTKEQKEMLEQYKMLQYDLLAGKQYSKEILLNRKKKNLYNDTSSFIVFNGVTRQAGFREYYLYI